MPEESRIVVTNTTPIIALTMIGQLDLLEKLYGSVLMPPAVENEIKAGGNPTTIAAMAKVPYIRSKELADPRRADLLNDLDRGEAEAVTLALEIKDELGAAAHLLIIDERLGRRHAKRLDLKITGTLGVLLRAKKEGHIEAIRPLIEQLVDGGIYLDKSLIEEVLKTAGE